MLDAGPLLAGVQRATKQSQTLLPSTAAAARDCEGIADFIS